MRSILLLAILVVFNCALVFAARGTTLSYVRGTGGRSGNPPTAVPTAQQPLSSFSCTFDSTIENGDVVSAAGTVTIDPSTKYQATDGTDYSNGAIDTPGEFYAMTGGSFVVQTTDGTTGAQTSETCQVQQICATSYLSDIAYWPTDETCYDLDHKKSGSITFDAMFDPTSSGSFILTTIGFLVTCPTSGLSYNVYNNNQGTPGSFALYYETSNPGGVFYTNVQTTYPGPGYATNFACTLPAKGFSDPIIRGFDGKEFDFKGLPNRVFNMFSLPDLQISNYFIPANLPGETYTGAIGIQQGGVSFIKFDLERAYLFANENDTLGKAIPYPMTAPLQLANGGIITRPSAGRLHVDFPQYSIHMVRVWEKPEGQELFEYIDFDLSLKIGAADFNEIHGVLGQTYHFSNQSVPDINAASFVAADNNVFTSAFPAASYRYIGKVQTYAAGEAKTVGVYGKSKK